MGQAGVGLPARSATTPNTPVSCYEDTYHVRIEHVHRGAPVLAVGAGAAVRGRIAARYRLEREHAEHRRELVREESDARSGEGALRAVLPSESSPADASSGRRDGRDRCDRGGGWRVGVAPDACLERRRLALAY